MSNHWPAHFYLVSDKGTSAGHQPARESMGTKAYNLWRMARMGLPVPSALVIGTHYTDNPGEGMVPLFTSGLPALERATGQCFGDNRNPLLVSVRSGAPVSMPGMMDTLLNVGLSDETAQGLLRQTGNPRLVWDAYRRLVASYGEVVAGLPSTIFEEALQLIAQGRDERLLDFSELRELTRRHLSAYAEGARQPFPQDPHEQLAGAVRAVFRSWQSDRAREYRRLNDIDGNLGTAVTIQRMVFGNSGVHAGAGVGFTRDPATGERRLWVDFLANAQGEDVVSGRRSAHGQGGLEAVAPRAWQQLEQAVAALEAEFGDMQDFEFTVEDGQLHLLQTRAGKRTPVAAARIALDLLDEGLIDRHTALARTAGLDESDLAVTVLASVDAVREPPLGTGKVACPGVACGEIALDEERVRSRTQAGGAVILVRDEAETSDLAAIDLSRGLLTARGARTSHAAVVARQLGVTCVVGCPDLVIDRDSRQLTLGGRRLAEGDPITLDGATGDIYPGLLAAEKLPDEDLVSRLRQLRAGGETASGCEAS